MRILLASVALIACVLSAAVSATRRHAIDYRDPQSRFVFSYPRSFGDASVGTDDGFGNRVAAVRFSIFSTAGIGGEAVLGKGRPSVDLQAAGGLYDDIVNGTLPPAMAKAIDAVLPRLTIANFCEQIGRERHVDIRSPPVVSLPDNQRRGVEQMDLLGNLAPNVSRCTVSGDTISFDKDAGMAPGGARRRTYGSIRFLTGRYSTFAIVRAGGTPSPALLDEIRDAVMSFKAP